jgi:hypothetical protein
MLTRPIGLRTVRPAASRVEESADQTQIDARTATNSHNRGRHRRDGSPEGKRRSGNTAAHPSSGYQNHVWVHAASSAAEGGGPGLRKATSEYHSPTLPMAVRIPTPRNSHPSGFRGRTEATTAPTVA